MALWLFVILLFILLFIIFILSWNAAAASIIHSQRFLRRIIVAYCLFWQLPWRHFCRMYISCWLLLFIICVIFCYLTTLLDVCISIWLLLFIVCVIFYCPLFYNNNKYKSIDVNCVLAQWDKGSCKYFFFLWACVLKYLSPAPTTRIMATIQYLSNYWYCD